MSDPTYSFMHWPDTWLENTAQEPLPRDPRVSVRLLPVESAGEHLVGVAMELTTTVPVRAFSLAFDSEEGMLRVPWVYVRQGSDPVFWQDDWAKPSRVVVKRGDDVVRFRSPDCPGEEEGELPCLPPDCPPADPCFGVPHSIRFWETEERYAVFDWTDLGVGGPYPGPEPWEIARLVIRAAENPKSTEVQIRPAVVTIGDGPFAETYQSGGIADIPSPVVPFSPAHEVLAATVRIGRSGYFVRGDVNTDGASNLSDAVSILGYLFASGGTPLCVDAADADDSGDVQLTDAIYLLQWLFGTGEAPPEPRECGEDPTDDDVPCDRNVCRRD